MSRQNLHSFLEGFGLSNFNMTLESFEEMVESIGEFSQRKSPSQNLKETTRVKVDKKNTTASTLEKIIDSNGPIPFSLFMGVCLSRYYGSEVKIGKSGGDFVTAPEISELFGASTVLPLIWSAWEGMGRPEKFTVVEVGAGNGSLAYSIIKWSKLLYPSLPLEYKIVEYSKELILLQKQNLSAFENVDWMQGSATNLPLSNFNGVIVANELIDAFPVDVVRRIDGEIKQKYVTIENGEWVELWDRPTSEVEEFIKRHRLNIKEKLEEPINMSAELFAQQLGEILESGMIILMDYGRRGEVGTPHAAAIRTHARTRITPDQESGLLKVVLRKQANETLAYEHPGLVDLTASVNYRILERILKRHGHVVHFSGLLKTLRRRLEQTHIAESMAKIIKNKRSWKDAVDLSYGWNALKQFSSYYVQVYSKGIRLPSLTESYDSKREF